MEWFRFYEAVLDNVKIQSLPGEIVKGWLNLLCLANSGNGVLPPLRTMAFRLRLGEPDTQALLQILLCAGLIDERDGYLEMHDWAEYQRVSDNSADRTRRYRARQTVKMISKSTSGNGAETTVTSHVTSPSRDGDALETETETEEKKEETTSAPPAPLKSSNRPKISEAQIRIQETVASVASHIKTRHPAVRNGMGVKAIGSKLSAILRRHSIPNDKAPEFLSALDIRHENWCATEQWTEKGGVYAKAIANWLSPSEDRYLEDPPAGSAAAARRTENAATSFPREIYGAEQRIQRTPEEIAVLREQINDPSPAIRRAAQGALAEYQESSSWKN